MNSNTIQIALDWQKQEQRREIARLLNQVTDLCNQKKIDYRAELSSEIKIGRHIFPCTKDGLRRARNYVLNLEQKELEMEAFK